VGFLDAATDDNEVVDGDEGPEVRTIGVLGLLLSSDPAEGEDDTTEGVIDTVLSIEGISVLSITSTDVGRELGVQSISSRSLRLSTLYFPPLPLSILYFIDLPPLSVSSV